MTNLTRGTHKCHRVHIIISANKSIYVSFTSMTCLHRGPLACLQEGLAQRAAKLYTGLAACLHNGLATYCTATSVHQKYVT